MTNRCLIFILMLGPWSYFSNRYRHLHGKPTNNRILRGCSLWTSSSYVLRQQTHLPPSPLHGQKRFGRWSQKLEVAYPKRRGVNKLFCIFKGLPCCCYFADHQHELSAPDFFYEKPANGLTSLMSIPPSSFIRASSFPASTFSKCWMLLWEQQRIAMNLLDAFLRHE